MQVECVAAYGVAVELFILNNLDNIVASQNYQIFQMGFLDRLKLLKSSQQKKFQDIVLFDVHLQCKSFRTMTRELLFVFRISPNQILTILRFFVSDLEDESRALELFHPGNGIYLWLVKYKLSLFGDLLYLETILVFILVYFLI
eukprot:TRINITY_DN764_c0_g1_i1.p5 TRINITY_DN764_c0_g1~~TRINITY_DN764_c0_g1_i1.p5  ORF type:complete len:144 (-),score=5.75 TRINITY_DN764_c0_g1_i1:1038-1469(-)